MSSWRDRLQREFQASTSLPLWREAFLGVDWISLRMSPVYRGIGIPKGDHSAVVVIPGFMGSDQYLGDMNSWLRRIGYQPYLSNIGRNADCPDILAGRLHQTMVRAYEETGARVHLVGHSLGGVLARSVAVRWPEMTASVTTMASPFRGVRVHPFVLQTAFIVRGRVIQKNGRPDHKPNCFSGYCSCAFVSALTEEFPASVRQQAIYTKSDGVVDWRCCINDDPETDIEVPGTHVGLAFNPRVYRHIATFLAGERVAQREDVA